MMTQYFNKHWNIILQLLLSLIIPTLTIFSNTNKLFNIILKGSKRRIEAVPEWVMGGPKMNIILVDIGKYEFREIREKSNQRLFYIHYWLSVRVYIIICTYKYNAGEGAQSIEILVAKSLKCHNITYLIHVYDYTVQYSIYYKYEQSKLFAALFKETTFNNVIWYYEYNNIHNILCKTNNDGCVIYYITINVSKQELCIIVIAIEKNLVRVSNSHFNC